LDIRQIVIKLLFDKLYLLCQYTNNTCGYFTNGRSSNQEEEIMMTRNPFLFFGFIAGILISAGCDNYEPSKESSEDSYFEGKVVVNYNKIEGPSDDNLIFRFNSEGTYVVSFAVVPRLLTPHLEDLDRKRMPRGFTEVVERDFREKNKGGPLTFTITKRDLPDFMVINIIKDGRSESHGFPGGRKK